MPHPPLQLLVGPRAQPITQDWVTHDHSTSTDYVFDREELKEIAAFSRAIHNNSLDPTMQLPERYLIVLRLYNFHVPSHARLSPLPPFQDRVQHAKMIQVSQDFVYRKNMASNQGAKRRAEQIDNGTAIFHSRNRKRPRIDSQLPSTSTDLTSVLDMSALSSFDTQGITLLPNPPLSAQSDGHSDQSAASSTSSAAEHVQAGQEHVQSTTGPIEDTSMAAENVLAQQY
ncbi:uncharacterized protein FOMMEDRAFT_153901 [Fomitiporia mediterranea MF3/22]|uniref:uncharacterized protein n=1 Tax=Fomitiporia mediterranea (strain MF3/22) TaxID=694068 RepID=UPI000440920E|nr:uncharacterized protein FOMMEDRAFT_153901 [Fomitiporia mediterranea MF3/22]EJD04801.1 hypothetical protein FOMMEDRAFT_153901 [Fomitiporia mediterranea MF3/22]